MSRVVRGRVVHLGAALVGHCAVPDQPALVAHGAVRVLLGYSGHRGAHHSAEQMLVHLGA
eukprot:4113184-Pyramimonas_sp.AAC.1